MHVRCTIYIKILIIITKNSELYESHHCTVARIPTDRESLFRKVKFDILFTWRLKFFKQKLCKLIFAYLKNLFSLICGSRVRLKARRTKDFSYFIDANFMHLSIKIPTAPPTPGQGGGMWEIFMVFEGTVRPWGGGFLRICFTHSSRGEWGLDSCLVSSR